MKRQVRRAMLRLAALIAMLGIIFLLGKADVAYAEGTDAGGTRAEAMEIQVDQTYSEVISDINDEDYFKFTTTERGYFQVTLAHNDADDTNVGHGWDINVMDKDEKVLASDSGITKSWRKIRKGYSPIS